MRVKSRIPYFLFTACANGFSRKEVAMIAVGQTLPEGKLMESTAFDESTGCPMPPQEVDVAAATKGKKIVIFGLPGAFTPTCTEQQLPGFEAAYDEIKGYGIDEVYCLSVNDAFVMNAWFDSLGITKVKALPDGNGSFTTSAGMAVQKTNLGFAIRSWRYAIVVDNGILEWSGVEEGKRDNASDDPYEASTPQRVVQYLQAKQDGWVGK